MFSLIQQPGRRIHLIINKGNRCLTVTIIRVDRGLNRKSEKNLFANIHELNEMEN